MIFRRIKAHVENENWFAVFIDFAIVVVGVFIGIQVANWNEARERRVSEAEYLKRLHSDVVELTERRGHYDRSRPANVERIERITDFLNEEAGDSSALRAEYVHIIETEFAEFAQPLNAKGIDNVILAESVICNGIDWVAAMTVPPSVLPTASELSASGNLERIASEDVKSALQSYQQQVSRADTFIGIQQRRAIRPSDQFPELFEIRYPKGVSIAWNDIETHPLYRCDFEAMAQNNAFLNAVNKLRGNYTEYTNRGVSPVSELLAELHKVIDAELGIEHADAGEAAP